MTHSPANAQHGVALVTGAGTAHRPRDRARPGAGRLGRRRALPQSRAPTPKRPWPRSRALGRRAAAARMPTWPTRRACRALLPRRPSRSGASTAWSTTLRCSNTTAPPPSRRRLLDGAHAGQRRPRRCCWRRRCTRPRAGTAAGRRDQPARPEAVQPEPRLFVVHAVKAALQTATAMLAQALAPAVRVFGVAPGITLVSGDQTDAGFAARAPGHAARASSTPQDIAARSATCRRPRDHRHHPAGRRRPAPDAAAARRDVPRRIKATIAVTACTTPA